MSSTTLITDTTAVQTATPTAATKTKAEAADMDYVGMTSAALAALDQAKNSINILVGATDSADPSLTKLQGVLASLS